MSSSSSSSSSRNWLYNVFPSFRGEDVRTNFLAHFLKELDRKLISTFRDIKMDKGQSLDPFLKEAIKDSRIGVVIFSQNYASSGWCLNELLEIVKCKNEFDQIVIPIFYRLDPSHVRKQTGYFGKIFKKTCKNSTKNEIRLWRQALTDVANLVGYHFQNCDDEAKLIEDVVNDILGRLDLTPCTDFEDFFGIEDHIAKMSVLLDLKSTEAKMVGIWGPSGIGKTTIARALFGRLSHQFQGRIFIDGRFISNSTEECRKSNPTDYNMRLHLQENFLSKFLGKPGIEVDHLGAVKGKLKKQKVLIFFDDLDDPMVLDVLAGGVEWFGHGSRIIAITKDMHILKGHGINCVYEVGIPSKDIALKILCQSAFGKNSPADGFMDVASEVAVRIGHLPLGLNVLGSSLKGRDMKHWTDLLLNLRKGLDGKIEKALSMSYEGLDRKEHKALFRHIACFFNGDEINNIKLMLADSELNVETGLEILVERSLIQVVPSWNSTNIVEMHCLLQEMGKEIVRGQSPDKPGEREFLMDSNDVCNVLNGRTGTEKILGISLSLDEVDKVEIHENAFEGMRNLRFLNFYRRSLEWKKEVKWLLPNTFNNFPDKLKLLSWLGYPMDHMPLLFCPSYLIELRLPNSKLKKLWDGVKSLTCLKVIDLSESENLEKLPDLSEATNLETLNLHGCSSLVSLPSSIQHLNKLTELNMTRCTKLENLPDVIMQSLIRLNLTGCSQLKTFPDISDKITELFLNKTAFEIFPSKLRLENLVELHMEEIISERLWEGVQPLPKLKTMVLGSVNLREIPDLSMATRLETLKLNNCSSLVELTPSSIQNLNKLTILEMIGCSSLETLPTGINLKSLYCLNLNGCLQLRSFPDISSNISILNLSQTAIEEVPRRIENYASLESLDMWECKYLETLPTDINIKSLYRLNLNGCSRLRSFPDISSNITTLYLNQTGIEEVPPWINNFSSLEALEMLKCKRLKCISSRIFKLKNLDEVFFSDCKQLADFRWLEEEEDTNNTSTNLSMVSFTNCVIHDQENFIKRSASKYLILPGEVPPYFTHQSKGITISIPLHHSSISQRSSLGFKACVVFSDPAMVSKGSKAVELCYVDIEVHCRYGDKHGNYTKTGKPIYASLHQKYDHLIIFDCHFPLIEDCDLVEIEFRLVPKERNIQIKECGLRRLSDDFTRNDNESIANDDGGYETALGEEECGDNSDDEGFVMQRVLNFLREHVCGCLGV